VNRLCGSGDGSSLGGGARYHRGEISLAIAGGVESMSRAPFVIPKAASAFSADRGNVRHHDRLAVRQSADGENVRNGVHAETAENVAEKYKIDRASQDCFALRLAIESRSRAEGGNPR